MGAVKFLNVVKLFYYHKYDSYTFFFLLKVLPSNNKPRNQTTTSTIEIAFRSSDFGADLSFAIKISSYLQTHKLTSNLFSILFIVISKNCKYVCIAYIAFF